MTHSKKCHALRAKDLMYICIIFMFRPRVTLVAMQFYICIQVEFVGEDGYDTGGLTREFFSWFGSAMSQRFDIYWHFHSQFYRFSGMLMLMY